MGAKRRTHEDWAGLIAELEASGQSPARFCGRRGISVARLKWWRWRLRSEGRARASSTAAMVRLLPVDVVGGAGASSVTIAVGGAELRVEVGTDVAYVGALVSALRSRC